MWHFSGHNYHLILEKHLVKLNDGKQNLEKFNIFQ